MKNIRAARKHTWSARTIALIIVALAVVAGLAVWGVWLYRGAIPDTSHLHNAQVERPGLAADSDNPISNRKFYVDNSRSVAKQAAEYKRTGDTARAQLMKYVADQPGAIWLTGPSASDQMATRDIIEVERTSGDAKAHGTIPVYQLYAIPGRDACADYSKGGFRSDAEYLSWVDRIISALKTDAVVAIEADAIAHTINTTCMSPEQVNNRYSLLQKTVMKLRDANHVKAAYLDAAHSDWFADPSALVEPLKKSGIDDARGVTVNVSFFAETAEITAWSKQLVELLGGDKGVMIDTSRNGKGIAQATGDARWCNPPGRGTGPRPTTVVNATHIDAYFWGKTIGESDGACFGNPPAGVFVPELALELARNASN